MSEPISVPLPVLTTHRPDRRDRGYLAWVAVANEVAHLPLDSAPVDAIPHALEIHVSGIAEPLVVIAQPMGPPTHEGFPLRLSPIDDAHEAALRHELFGGTAPPPRATREAASGRAYPTPGVAFELPSKNNSTIPPPLSRGHAMALGRTVTDAGTSTLARRAPGALSGRVLGDGRFHLERLLGGGASGEVYRALHSALRRHVAVKVLHPQLQQSQDYCTRFYGEALAASRLDHRNVLRVLDYGQEPDSLLYIVMELLEGDSLQQILDRDGALPLDRIVHLVTQACAGLAHAHDAGVVHRDIKPENIVVVKRRDDEGRETELVKVCDFGIAHWTPVATTQFDEDSVTLINRPDASQIVGTPVYMAPEQIRNEAVDARTDVYALGVVLYELATGHLPFVSESSMEILSKHLLEAPPRPTDIAPDLDPAFDAIILKALSKDPEQRHRDARELRSELRELVDDAPNDAFASHRRVSLRSALTASDFLGNTTEALENLHGIDERVRGIAYGALGEAVKTAFVSGNAKLGRDLVAWIDGRLADPGLSAEERDDADRARHALRDPDVVRSIIAHLADAKPERRGELLALLAGAGPVAAHALIDLRRRRMASLELRSQFVAMLRALGHAALPAIIAALEPLVQLASRQDEALAEDLLRSLPEVRSDQAGDVAARFVRLDRPSIGIAALRAIAALWGVRARPLLVGVLDANVDAFRLIAIESLQRLGGIDDGGLERLARIIASQSGASDEVRIAAAAAFASALPDCHPRAIWFLQQRLTPQQGFMGSILKAIGPREDVRVLAALGRSLAHLDPHGARAHLERLAVAQPEMRPYVDAIFAGR